MHDQFLRIVLILLSGTLTLIAALPYLRDILRGQTKPRIASWLIWTAIPALGAAASFTQHQIPAAVFALVVTLQGLAIVVLGYKHGDRSLELVDIICLIGAAAGLIALVLVKSPVLALVLILITDFLGLVPTVKHAWLRPHEETWSLFALEGIGCVITLLISDWHVFTAIGYPLYLLICDAIVTGIILVRSRPQFSPAPIPAPVLPSSVSPQVPALSITYSVDSQPNAAGWYAKPVTVTFAAHDETAGIASCSPPVTLDRDGANQTVIGRAINNAGESTSVSVVVNIDQTPPTLGAPIWSSNPADRSSLVTLSLPVVDHTSGVEEGECFGPTDPGPGQAALMTLANGQLSFTFRASMTPGHYPLQVRAKDAAGNWSAVVTAALVAK